MCFLIPAAISLLGAGALYLTLRDTPSSVGLPELENQNAEEKKQEEESVKRPLTSDPAYHKAFLRHMVFGNKIIWILAATNFFVYIVRFSMLDWGMMLLPGSKGVSVAVAGIMVAVFEFVGGNLGMVVAVVVPVASRRRRKVLQAELRRAAHALRRHDVERVRVYVVRFDTCDEAVVRHRRHGNRARLVRHRHRIGHARVVAHVDDVVDSHLHVVCDAAILVNMHAIISIVNRHARIGRVARHAVRRKHRARIARVGVGMCIDRCAVSSIQCVASVLDVTVTAVGATIGIIAAILAETNDRRHVSLTEQHVHDVNLRAESPLLGRQVAHGGRQVDDGVWVVGHRRHRVLDAVHELADAPCRLADAVCQTGREERCDAVDELRRRHRVVLDFVSALVDVDDVLVLLLDLLEFLLRCLEVLLDEALRAGDDERRGGVAELEAELFEACRLRRRIALVERRVRAEVVVDAGDVAVEIRRPDAEQCVELLVY